jgi:hypothetical protein
MTTKAATPAASNKVAKALADVAGATAWAEAAGTWPKTDFETVVFILYSLQKGFVCVCKAKLSKPWAEY